MIKTEAARCIRVTYKPGTFELIQGVKGHQVGKVHEGKFFRNRGFGWGQYSEPSKLTLHHEVNGEKYETWIDYFFKNHLGALREEVREAIKATMPETIRVQEQVSRRGTLYYVVPTSELQKWLTRIRAIPPAQVAKVKKRLKRKKRA